MSKSTINETEKSSLKTIFNNVEERVKKLEEFFDSIEYISPAPYEYKIIIEDEKIKTLSLNKFNMMSSLHFLFISFNDILPVFRINVDKHIKIESFDKIIDDNKLIILIKELEPIKVFNEKRKNIFLKSFFDIILKRIYKQFISLLKELKNNKNIKKAE